MVGDPSLFRSEEMTYAKVYINSDVAHDVLVELGHLNCVEFVDLNPTQSSFQREFAHEVKRCEEMERKLRLLRELIEDSKIDIPAQDASAVPLNDLELLLNEKENEVTEANRHFTDLTRAYKEHLEQSQVLRECMSMPYAPKAAKSTVETDRDQLLTSVEDSSTYSLGKVGQICGCLPANKAAVFERVAFRATRGNCLTTFSDLDYDEGDSGKKGGSGKKGESTGAEKVVFMTTFSGSAVGSKIRKVADAFQANVYHFPDSAEERTACLNALSVEVGDLKSVLSRTEDSRHSMLYSLAQSLTSYEKCLAREKAIFHTLNLFQTGRTLRGEFWCPTSNLDSVERAVGRVKGPKTIVKTLSLPREAPPTHFETNKLSSGFQAIVEAYGVANYQEFNPTPFTVITFPFLFAVMFGDAGHGTLMLLFAIFMIAFEGYFIKNPPGEIFGICFGGRYVILLMSLFSVYTGLLYNDTFALAFNWFGTNYEPTCVQEGCEHGYVFSSYKFNADNNMVFDPESSVVKFGLDPVWKQSENELSYTNSLKMKLSIVFGVIQMSFGVILSGLNHIYFKNTISLIHEFIPQILFLVGIFGYMVACIFVKWGTYYENTHCAPSILTLFIDMFLQMGTVNYEEGCENEAYLFSNQETIEQILLVVAVISVPWMLLAKPLLLRAKHANAENKHKQLDDSADPEFADNSGVHGEHEEFDFSEEMVHQIIHTIEFVLGCVSNTASYLRLWALSLAHAQLSTVFWEKVMIDNMHGASVVVIVIAFVVWFCCTFAVLMVMESLSAFLHALRLHWVEFQNKFYQGVGRKFAPFGFV